MVFTYLYCPVFGEHYSHHLTLGHLLTRRLDLIVLSQLVLAEFLLEIIASDEYLD